MRAKEFIVESDVLKMINHFKKYKPVPKNIDMAYGLPDPEGKYFKFADVENLLNDHHSNGTGIERYSPHTRRSGFQLTADMVENPEGQFVNVHDVLNVISGMHH